MSWSLDRNCAIWFARRWVPHRGRNPLCLKGQVSKGDILAYFASEDEVIVRSGRVRNVIEIPVADPDGG